METNEKTNFIINAIDEDNKNHVYTDERVHTRFPPEPNGYLHIGHAKASLLNYRIAKKYNGKFNLRFDDTNPVKEDIEYVNSIKEDLSWLGIDWEDRLYFASSYFSKMAEYAVELIKKGLAFVDDLNADQIREYRGTLKEPGKESPFRNRSVSENLELFEKMKAGEFDEGVKVLRAKIDMASPNMNMRDPVIYRILHTKHPNTNEDWYIYPMYDFAHPVEDAIEGITHSLCTLEFEDHRPFYDWVLANLDDFKAEHPRQIEFAKLNLSGTIMGKRYLKRLVDEGIVDGWDDPRLATISGMRRRGYTPEAIQAFCEEIGVAKANSTVDIAMLEHFIRDDLKLKAPRVNAVLDPLKVTITNYPEGQTEWLEIETNLDVPEMGMHKMPFGREIYVEKSDFMEVPVKKYFRLFPGNEVRLRGAYFITCNEVIKDENGEVIELKCTYDPETKSGSGFTGRKVKGTIHWVSADLGKQVEVHMLNPLLKDEEGFDADTFLDKINPDSLKKITAWVEPRVLEASPYDKFQFVRQGYFSVDPKYSTEGNPVFNQVVPLKSSWRPGK
ncbi:MULTISPECIES: glutamine--tRNA ligase/YqeY domain fusion protein [Eubacterium]|uniref:glutamine--tRNA ligase/YqeY domain fusion protein n=1 Tax=Eubacterium TaxID=1730 RepID=UPI0011DE0E91|nr:MULTISPECIES: glutamine--tRNA ligase/YqeY domain fusion protein [Eubacterium]MBS4858230.1 glutamine--tRNA ligase/YqeY domain fusion protein [Eubacterium limosum]MBV1685990.1 glutamine--tRNA ligase/YqeY domain fusion protein [Eubacterium callanderi]MCC3403427.1 glutamine--tRNA ligase/YqeY domain fusion protein [Eubacterium callanderi]MCG4591186.1 glutamine--tRNA ligase/YqeY domain fusion protein [Eubacterium callanderi]MCQ4822525.1 glutamine--tRNA ligase/YqeY domain fusion protein [Eubacteri